MFLFRTGHKLYLYRAIDEEGVVVDILLREHRDTAGAQAFFRQAIERAGVIPDEVVTDRHQPYIEAVATTCPGTRHVPDRAAPRTRRDDHRGRTQPRTHTRSAAQQPWVKRTETGQRFLEGFAAVRHLRRDGAPGAGYLVPGPARHARVRSVVTIIHTLRRSLIRQ